MVRFPRAVHRARGWPRRRALRGPVGNRPDAVLRPWQPRRESRIARGAPLAGARPCKTILAAGFQAAGLEDLDREIIIAAAGLVASMDVRPARLGRQGPSPGRPPAPAGLQGQPVSAVHARRALPAGRRREVARDEVADALDRLVAAGLADREGDDQWVLRAKGSEAWIRLGRRRLRGRTYGRRRDGLPAREVLRAHRVGCVALADPGVSDASMTGSCGRQTHGGVTTRAALGAE